jgi:hypothetical protein
MFRSTSRIFALVVLFLGGIHIAYGQTGFSSTKLVSLKPHKASGRACVNLEATFSDSLRTLPSAMMESEDSSIIDGAISFALKVTRLNPKRYLLSLISSGEKECAVLKSNVRNVSVTIDGATSRDGKTLLPEQKRFSTRALF